MYRKPKMMYCINHKVECNFYFYIFFSVFTGLGGLYNSY